MNSGVITTFKMSIAKV